jgi:UDP-N-acetylmuramate dehydrogenase
VQFESNKSLASLNTLGFDQSAEHYIEVDSNEQLNMAVEYANQKNWQIFILGGGSNIVLTQDIPGLVIRQTNQSIQFENRGGENSWLFRVTATAAIDWHGLVQDTMSRSVAGLENLSLIPGSTGAAPVQNIGAYGVELTDRFESLQALHLPTNEWRTFSKSDCEFSYRDSFFKRHKNEYCITSVNLLLGKDCAFETNYAGIKNEIEHIEADALTPQDISQAVCKLRESKLPDPATIGNAGSFFHNPIIPKQKFEQLQSRFKNLVSFPEQDGNVKLAAGWLIDSLGLRGDRQGAVGVYEKQALVLVHHGGGDGQELLNYAHGIQQAVRDKFDVELKLEPQVI